MAEITETNQLYSVRTQGLGLFYVVAKDSHSAYRKVRETLDENLKVNYFREIGRGNLSAQA